MLSYQQFTVDKMLESVEKLKMLKTRFVENSKLLKTLLKMLKNRPPK